MSVRYSDIEGGWSGEGNVNVDPIFRDIWADDYHLSYPDCNGGACSPCVDIGDPAISDERLECGAGLGTHLSDMGAYGGANIGWPTSIEEPPTIPSEPPLICSYPNPFNSSTTIMSSATGEAEIGIFDISGRQVECLQTTCGRAVWDARGQASGLYFAKFVSGPSMTKEQSAGSIKLIYLK